MLKGAPNTSDLVFSPGRLPQVKVNGRLVPVNIQGVAMLTPADTAQIAADLMGRNAQAAQKLKEEGSCDISYGLTKVARFRVNVFSQRGSCAIVMRVIPSSVPDFAILNLPEQLKETALLRNGIVLVTGPTGSGKSSTLAAILNKINEENAYHIITIEDPIEFLHAHKTATVHQRELHSDTLNFGLALRAALRMREEMTRVNAERGNDDLMLKIGIHEGPCLAVRLNDSQDYFGQTVNMAARVQGLASSRAIFVTKSVVDDPRAAKILQSSGLRPSEQRAALRGIADETTVYEIP